MATQKPTLMEAERHVRATQRRAVAKAFNGDAGRFADAMRRETQRRGVGAAASKSAEELAEEFAREHGITPEDAERVGRQGLPLEPPPPTNRAVSSPLRRPRAAQPSPRRVARPASTSAARKPQAAATPASKANGQPSAQALARARYADTVTGRRRGESPRAAEPVTAAGIARTRYHESVTGGAR